MDAESSIRHPVQLREDPISTKHLDNQSRPSGILDPDGLLCHLGRIYVTELGNLRLRVLQYSHDHPLAGHFRSDEDFTSSPYATTIGPDFQSTFKDYCKSMHHLFPRQTCAPKPLWDFSSNFRFQKKPWNSIIHGFHREAPPIFRLHLDSSHC